MRKLLYAFLCGVMIIPNANAIDLSLQDTVDKIVAKGRCKY